MIQSSLIFVWFRPSVAGVFICDQFFGTDQTSCFLTSFLGFFGHTVSLIVTPFVNFSIFLARLYILSSGRHREAAKHPCSIRRQVRTFLLLFIVVYRAHDNVAQGCPSIY